MLKTRLIGVLIIRNGIVVQSIGFKDYLPVGSPAIAVDYLNRWGIDEIVMLDIDATPSARKPMVEELADYSKHCQVPLTVGGGISKIKDIEQIIRKGADKVVINSAAVGKPELISEGARLFGSQCIVGSMDARFLGNGGYETFTCSGKKPSGFTAAEHARFLEDNGAGEIFLNSIDRDGSKKGYDLELIRLVVESVRIPVIVCGVVDHPEHFASAMQHGVSAVAAANFFHYTEHSAIIAKRYLESTGTRLRLDTYADYSSFEFTESGRAAKMSDLVLDQLRFEYTPEEVI